MTTTGCVSTTEAIRFTMKEQQRACWRRRLLLGAVIVAAALLRFNGLERESRNGDEYLQTMAYSLPPQYAALSSRTVGQPPLDTLIGWAVSRISPSLAAMRLPAACFGVVGVALTFLLVRSMTDQEVAAFVAAGIVALSPLHWKMSQTARPYTIFVAAFLLAMWALWRALSRPDRKRLVAYGLLACLMTHTRSLGPLVILLSTGIVLAVVYLRLWAAGRRRSVAARAVLRVGLVTVLVAVAAIPILLFVMTGASEWTSLDRESVGGVSAALEQFGLRWVANLGDWRFSLGTWFGPVASVVLVAAAAGLGLCVKSWREKALAARTVWSVMVLAVPVYLTTYSILVPEWPIRDRYGLFVVPVVALFAGLGVEGVWRWMRDGLTRKGIAQAALVAMVMAVWVSPALGTADWCQRYGNPDWRACAAYLSDKVGRDDVVVLLADRELGASQPPFWGKADLPKEQRPLAESAWTFATSEPHWQRLMRQGGRVFVVLMHMSGPTSREGYRTHGLQAAPRGWRLQKFRRLDLFERVTAEREGGARALLHACDLMATLTLEYREARAIPLLLKSRALMASGQKEEAAAVYQSAMGCVPQGSRAWFTRATSVAPSFDSLRSPDMP